MCVSMSFTQTWFGLKRQSFKKFERLLVLCCVVLWRFESNVAQHAAQMATRRKADVCGFLSQ
jgi:hypothetical protein